MFVYCLYHIFAFNPVWVQVSNKIYSILFYSILFYSILFYSILFYSILLSQSLTLSNQTSRYILKCIRIAYSDVRYGVSNHCFGDVKCLTAKLLQQGYRYHKLRKTFSKFYRRHYELISKYNVGLKTLLSEGLSEPEFYGDLVYKFKKLIGINDFSFQFRKIITRYRRIGYNLNVMRQSACLVFNPVMVDNYAAFFNCTPVGRASDSMMAPT